MFPSDWKKAPVATTYKKGDKLCLKNYRPITLLLICSKIFECVINNELFTFFTYFKLISPNKASFRPGY